MTLYETIFARRSVRKYDEAVLDEEALDEIRDVLGSAKQLPGMSARFEIAHGDDVKGSIAPYDILAFAADADAEYVNIGYTLQGVDLWLQSNGYGSVWNGMAKPKGRADDFRMLLGFGLTGEPLRAGEADFKRKKLSEISNSDNAIAHAARVAPSAVNQQPWKLDFFDELVVIRANVSGMGRLIPGKMFLIDLGIVTKHVEVALEHEGMPVTAIEVNGDGKSSSVEVLHS